MKEIPNLSYIDKLANGNKLFVTNLLDIIKRELPTEIRAYKLHLGNKNFNETASDVHKINHKIKILGLEKSFEIAEQYKLNLLEQRVVLKLDFEAILKELVFYIKKV